MDITISDIRKAIDLAASSRENRPDVVKVRARQDIFERWIYRALQRGTYMRMVRYRKMRIRNNNGKWRDILSPFLWTLILQHLCIIKLNPYYSKCDNGLGMNCKTGTGITAKQKNKSLLRRAKHLFYDLRSYHFLLVIDQRKCYDHIREKTLRRALKYMGVPRWLNDFACNICFYQGVFPIGTPTSPLAHHCVMLKFDHYMKNMGCYALRYADNIFCAFKTSEEANAAKWRIKNFWWYEYGIRAKRHSVQIFAIDESSVDVCGFIIHRNKGKGITDQNKGYVSIRKSIYNNALQSSNKNWGSYFGLMKHADAYQLMRKIESKMKLRELTEKIRINRNLDAEPILVKELAEKSTIFNIYDYDIKFNKTKPDWIKCLIGVPNPDTGKEDAYEFHGSYHGIAEYLFECEKEFTKELMLPIECAEIENRCGYIFKGSTNVIKYIES